MKLSCSIAIGNRLQSNVPISRVNKHVISTLALCKHPKSSDYCILLFTAQHKTGSKYELKNISKVLTRFVNEGKATIQFHAPPHDLYIQADAVLLKSFLHLLKRASENKLSDKEQACSSMSINATALKPAVKKLSILSRADYPPKGFPRTIEVLHINHIQRCSLDQGILQLKKLRILDLSHNCIEYLPMEVNHLPCISELNLSHNEFGKSSLKQWSWLGGQICKTLKLLNMSNNNLGFLPNQLIKLHSLVALHLDNNQIKILPSGIGNLKHLKLFTASNNLISILPGSTRKLKLQTLDLSNNSFSSNPQGNLAAIFPKQLPVRSLKEYAARRVLHLQLSYTSEIIPQTVVDYLDYTKYCVCGQGCFSTYFQQPQILLLTSIAQTVHVSTNDDDFFYVPTDCYFCSRECFRLAHHHRARLPFIR